MDQTRSNLDQIMLKSGDRFSQLTDLTYPTGLSCATTYVNYKKLLTNALSKQGLGAGFGLGLKVDSSIKKSGRALSLSVMLSLSLLGRVGCEIILFLNPLVSRAATTAAAATNF